MPPGQHRLALMQTRKDHSRLEKTLLQQQRDLRRLEEAYKITQAGMQLFFKRECGTTSDSSHSREDENSMLS